MDRGAAGTSWRYTRSGSHYNQPDNDNAASSTSMPYGHGTVRQSNTPSPRTFPRRNEYLDTSAACASGDLPRRSRSVTPTQSFNNLIKKEKFDEIARKSHYFGDRYDGRN